MPNPKSRERARGAANLTADGLSRIADQLENIGQSGILDAGLEVLDRVEKEFYRLEVHVREIDKLKKTKDTLS